MKRLILITLLCLTPAIATVASSQPEPNHLIDEKSPYLLQHAYNPVDWYPWGDEAFERARSEGKPIFLSIGYSTCHWCHVMERESFSDPEIARLLNESFISIKVDREERPDIDAMYQAFLAATGSDGGWPANLFLTPDLDPFYGGTYFPPRDRSGTVGLATVVKRLASSWSEHREQVDATAEQMTRAIASLSAPTSSEDTLDQSTVDLAFEQLSSRYQSGHGGFSPAPKFPQPSIHELLLRYNARTGSARAAQMSLDTLRAMASGGIYDQLGGGFHRYSVDSEWHVPHFEKMLYDQAQLVNVYLSALQLTGDQLFGSVAAETLDFVLSSMTSPDGGFYSALDASSLPTSEADEKQEGAFYTWSLQEVASLFDQKSLPVIAAAYAIREDGNVDPRLDPSGELKGRNVLARRVPVSELAKTFSRPPAEIEAALQRAGTTLARARSNRPAPYLDDKILASWNGLMISAFARASQILDDERYLEAAVNAARFADSNLRNREDGRLWRRWRDGHVGIPGFAEDYAFLIHGLLDLYEASFDLHWLELARELQQQQDDLFWNDTSGFYSLTAASEDSPLVDVPGDVDSVLPSHNSVSAMNLMRLGQLTGNDGWHDRVVTVMNAFGGTLSSNPQTMPLMVSALSSSLGKPKQIIIAGDLGAADTRELLTRVHQHYVPDRLLILADGSDDQKRLAEWMPFIEFVQPIGGKATAYVCENFACKLPTSDPSVLSRQLRELPDPASGEPHEIVFDRSDPAHDPAPRRPDRRD